MSIAEIHQLPLNEKLQIMEAIWEDLRSRAGEIPVPDWHKALLDERRNAVAEGHEQIFDWDQVKRSLGSKPV
jgi:putative addiction module component (TIGR02574 family)